MKWEVRKKEEKWGIFLMQEYCRTDEPVCYGVCTTKKAAETQVDRLNNPTYEEEI